MNPIVARWLPWVVAAVLALILGWVLIFSGDAEELVADAPSTSAVVTTTIPTTTIPPTTSTVPTTTVPSTTTSTPETTTTVTTAPTTTIPALTVELTDEGIQAGDTWVYFGYDDEDTIAAVAAVLGAPTSDTGWVEDFLCPPPVVRTVRWNDFWVLFTKGDTDFWSGGGVPHFFTFFYSGSSPELFTSEGIGRGATIEELRVAYPAPAPVMSDSPFDPDDGFWSYDLQTWTGMWGFTTGETDADTITSINGGQGCGE